MRSQVQLGNEDPIHDSVTIGSNIGLSILEFRGDACETHSLGRSYFGRELLLISADLGHDAAVVACHPNTRAIEEHGAARVLKGVGFLDHAICSI